jgi:TM2 domain-containing membrane protein YozV
MRELLHWAVGCVVVYLGLFGIGSLLLGSAGRGIAFLIAAVVLTAWIVSDSRKVVLE